MGQAAELLLEGILDSDGTYSGFGHCRGSRPVSPNPKSKAVNGVFIFLRMRKVKNFNDGIELVKVYTKENGFEGILTKCCEFIQEDFNKFREYVEKRVIL